MTREEELKLIDEFMAKRRSETFRCDQLVGAIALTFDQCIKRQFSMPRGPADNSSAQEVSPWDLYCRSGVCPLGKENRKKNLELVKKLESKKQARLSKEAPKVEAPASRRADRRYVLAAQAGKERWKWRKASEVLAEESALQKLAKAAEKVAKPKRRKT